MRKSSNSGKPAVKRVTFENACSTIEITGQQAITSRVATDVADDMQLQSKVINQDGCPVCHLKQSNLISMAINAVTSCEHVVCCECALRLIFIAKQEADKQGKVSCPICHQVLTQVILTRQAVRTPENVKNFLAQCMEKSFRVRWFLKIVYIEGDDMILEAVRKLLYFQCNSCFFDFSRHTGILPNVHLRSQSDFMFISKHLKNKHETYLCDLCFFNLELFPAEFEFFSSSRDLRNHKRNGFMLGNTFVKHQNCLICQEPDGEYRFFDEQARLAHLKKNHLSCHLCTESVVFCRDQQALAQHIDEMHNAAPLCHLGGGMEQVNGGSFSFTEAHYSNTESGQLLTKPTRPQVAEPIFNGLGILSNSKTNQIKSLMAGLPVGRGKQRMFLSKLQN